MNNHNRPTGLDLKFTRLTLGIQAQEIARSLGVTPQRVSAIEAAFHPSPSMVARYLAVLDGVATDQNASESIGPVSSSAATGSGDGVSR